MDLFIKNMQCLLTRSKFQILSWFILNINHLSVLGNVDKKRPDPGEQKIKIQEIIVHPHFHSFTFDSDIALLYLAEPVIRGPTAVPACLPDPHLSEYLLRVTQLQTPVFLIDH